MSIQFSLFRIPVRIHLWFWLMALMLWTFQSEQSWGGLLIWVAIVFQGVFMHELGHALVGRAFGREPRIELIALGGVTWWEQRQPMGPWRSILVSIAGPAVGIVIGLGALLLLDLLRLPDPSLAHYTFRSLIWVNLGWGVLNLVPVLPLDGGNIVASAMELVSPTRGRLIACYVSFGVIGMLLVIMIKLDQYPIVILLILLGFSTYQAYRIERQRLGMEPGAVPEPDPMQAAFAALEQGDGRTVIDIASRLVAQAGSTDQLDDAFHLLAWGRLLNGEPGAAHEALSSMSGHRAPDPALEGAVLVELGKPAEAVPLLERACEGGGAFVEAYYKRALREKNA